MDIRAFDIRALSHQSQRSSSQAAAQYTPQGVHVVQFFEGNWRRICVDATTPAGYATWQRAQAQGKWLLRSGGLVKGVNMVLPHGSGSWLADHTHPGSADA